MEDYQVKQSRTNHNIPIINGIHLHSEYDPIKEAKEFVIDFQDQLKTNCNALVLGLGFGYHITEIVNELKKFHNQYKVFVIEPSSHLYNDFISYDLPRDPQVEIVCSSNIEKIYNNKDLIFFLTEGPTVIAHPASLNIHSKFFHSFMDFRQKEDMASIASSIEDSSIRNYVEENSEEELNFEEFIKKIKNKSILGKNELLFLILDKIN